MQSLLRNEAEAIRFSPALLRTYCKDRSGSFSYIQIVVVSVITSFLKGDLLLVAGAPAPQSGPENKNQPGSVSCRGRDSSRIEEERRCQGNPTKLGQPLPCTCRTDGERSYERCTNASREIARARVKEGLVNVISIT